MCGGETESMKGIKFEARISNLRKLLLKHVTYVRHLFSTFSPSLFLPSFSIVLRYWRDTYVISRVMKIYY